VIGKTKVQGKPSLQNSLEVIRGYLSLVPTYGSREVLILWNSLTTVDPNDIFQTIEVRMC
jgi:transcription initiation factor TFIIH subunit 2